MTIGWQQARYIFDRQRVLVNLHHQKKFGVLDRSGEIPSYFIASQVFFHADWQEDGNWRCNKFQPIFLLVVQIFLNQRLSFFAAILLWVWNVLSKKTLLDAAREMQESKNYCNFPSAAPSFWDILLQKILFGAIFLGLHLNNNKNDRAFILRHFAPISFYLATPASSSASDVQFLENRRRHHMHFIKCIFF